MKNRLLKKTKHAKEASLKLAALPINIKNNALMEIANSLKRHSISILKANKKDLEEAKKSKLGEVLVKRLALDMYKIDEMV